MKDCLHKKKLIKTTPIQVWAHEYGIGSLTFSHSNWGAGVRGPFIFPLFNNNNNNNNNIFGVCVCEFCVKHKLLILLGLKNSNFEIKSFWAT